MLDLRSEAECADDPPAVPDFRHRRLSLFAHYNDDPAYRADLLERVASLDAAERYSKLYTEALDLDRQRFAEALHVLAAAEEGALFHCVGGKDRTGVLAALVLRLADVAMDVVEAHYIRTEERALQAGLTLTHRYSASAHAVTIVIDGLEAKYGTTANYLRAAGGSEADIAAIASKFLRPTDRA